MDVDGGELYSCCVSNLKFFSITFVFTFHGVDIMVFKSLVCVAGLLFSAVQSVPVEVGKRQAQGSVPDYVLRYGELLTHCVHVSRGQEDQNEQDQSTTCVYESCTFTSTYM